MARSKQTARKASSSKKAEVLVHGQRHLKEAIVGVISAGFSGGQPKGGVDQGPKHLLAAGLEEQLSALNWTVELHHPNCDTPTSDPGIVHKKIKNAAHVSSVCSAVSECVKKVAAVGHLPLTLGGDHSLAMGSISGTAAVYPNLGVIWVDAHADINTPESTDSGNLHGCPVSFLTGLAGDVAGFEWLKPCLAFDRIVYIGLRDVDAPEKAILKENNIRAFSMYEVDKYGIAGVLDKALDYLGTDSPIHLTFDVDALDPSVAPATGTPVRGGLTFREGHFICERMYESGSLVGVDIMEVNPCIGGEVEKEQTVRIGCSLVSGGGDLAFHRDLLNVQVEVPKSGDAFVMDEWG